MYLVPKSKFEAELEIKKSRFIASLNRATTRQSALSFLNAVKKEYSNANHHCWAYVLGNPGKNCSAASDDDGEPSGTAGKPILNILQHKQAGDTIVVVSRYFGGIKLGAGGLVRAYSQAAQRVAEISQFYWFESQIVVSVNCDFPQENLVRVWAENNQSCIVNAVYSSTVDLQIRIPESKLSDLKNFLENNQINSCRLEEPNSEAP